MDKLLELAYHGDGDGVRSFSLIAPVTAERKTTLQDDVARAQMLQEVTSLPTRSPDMFI